MEALILKTLIDSIISHDGFISVNDVLKQWDVMKEAIKNPNSINFGNI